jgi:hypothetical protein
MVWSRTGSAANSGPERIAKAPANTDIEIGLFNMMNSFFCGYATGSLCAAAGKGSRRVRMFMGERGGEGGHS